MSLLFRSRDIVKDTANDNSITKYGAGLTRGKGAEVEVVAGIESFQPTALTALMQANTVGTIMQWIRFPSPTQPTYTIWRGVAGPSSITFNYAGSGGGSLFYGIGINAGVTQWQFQENPGTALANNEWIHTAVVQDGVSPKLYLNGQLRTVTYGTTTDLTFWFSGFSMTAFGWCADPVTLNNQFEGFMDDLQVWDEALSAGYLADYYNSYYKYF